MECWQVRSRCIAHDPFFRKRLTLLQPKGPAQRSLKSAGGLFRRVSEACGDGGRVSVELPIGLDYDWLASDADGHIARFTTAGLGPIPTAVIAVGHTESLTRALPFIGDYEMRVTLPDPTDFINIARRGFFGYDWRDAARTARLTKSYEIVSLPLRPVRFEELPPELQQLAGLVRFESLRFMTSDCICVGRLLECMG
jgi:hypothetical protein